MFREDRPLLSWLSFGLHFGIVLGAKFATILHFGGFRVHFSDPGGKKIHHHFQGLKNINFGLRGELSLANPSASEGRGGNWALLGALWALGGWAGLAGPGWLT